MTGHTLSPDGRYGYLTVFGQSHALKKHA